MRWRHTGGFVHTGHGVWGYRKETDRSAKGAQSQVRRPRRVWTLQRRPYLYWKGKFQFTSKWSWIFVSNLLQINEIFLYRYTW